MALRLSVNELHRLIVDKLAGPAPFISSIGHADGLVVPSQQPQHVLGALLADTPVHIGPNACRRINTPGEDSAKEMLTLLCDCERPTTVVNDLLAVETQLINVRF